MGLGEGGPTRVSRIVIHPTNPDIVYVAMLGHSHGPQATRGIFRTMDGENRASAGMVGFKTPDTLSASDRLLYDNRLRQVKWSRKIQKKYGVSGSHMSWLSRRFARGYLAELIVENEAANAVNASAE